MYTLNLLIQCQVFQNHFRHWWYLKKKNRETKNVPFVIQLIPKTKSAGSLRFTTYDQIRLELNSF